MLGPNTKELNITSSDKEVTLWVRGPNLNSGSYDISVAIFDIDLVQIIDHLDKVMRFRITNDVLKYGSVVIDTDWEKNS